MAKMLPAEPFRALIASSSAGRPALVRILPLTERSGRQPRVRSELISQLDESLEALEMLKARVEGLLLEICKFHFLRVGDERLTQVRE